VIAVAVTCLVLGSLVGFGVGYDLARDRYRPKRKLWVTLLRYPWDDGAGVRGARAYTTPRPGGTPGPRVRQRWEP
jgi:hypothetical protein